VSVMEDKKLVFKFEHLLSPIKIGTMELRNRIVMPAMGSGHASPDSNPSDAIIGYYEARAKGGVGLIITEITIVHASSKEPRFLAIDNDSLIPRWREVARAIHKHGGKIWPQLAHQGRQGPSAGTGQVPMAASAIPCPMIKEMPREMSGEDIEMIVEAFGEAARRSREAGLDGVELHGAHGYLICNFISPFSNKRTDEYGGSIMGRLRFPLEILERIKAKCGNDFPVGIRLSCDEMVEGGLTPEEVEIMAPILAEAGFDTLSISRAGYPRFRWLIPPAGTPVGLLAAYSERIKKLVKIPVMVAHRIQDPVVAEQIIAQGKADLACMGRALIADPDLPNKVATGRLDDIVPCIACNQGCLGRVLVEGLPIRCLLNPTTAHEKEMALVPTQKPKKVLVAGGGIGGLEAARVAALRGHQVTLIEKTDKLGGQFNLAAIPPAKQEFAKAVQYLSTQVRKASVKVELGREVTPELVNERRPDVVIVATGSAPIVPASIPGMGKPVVVTAHDVLAGKAVVGDKVIVIGGGDVGCETAGYIGERGAKEITVVEMLGDVAMDVIPWTREFLMERLGRYRVKIRVDAKVKEILDDGVVLSTNGGEESIRGVDTIVLAMGAKSVDDLSNQISDKVAEIYVIGDALKPRQAIEAIAEGAEVGRRI